MSFQYGRVLATGLTLAIVAALAGCAGGPGGSAGRQPSPAASPAAGARIPVIAGFYPLEEALRRIGGDRVEAANVVPAGGEPHEVELTPRDIERLRRARLLAYVGAGFQPAIERAIESNQLPGVTAIDVTKGLTLLTGADDHDAAEKAPGGAEPLDPHVWLDPVLMQQIAGTLRDALIAIDPAGRPAYAANAAAYQAELAALDAEFRAGLRNCRRKEIVTSHASFAYLAKRYGLEQEPITGLSPEVEPSPQRLQSVVQFAKQHDVKAIYFETLVDPKVAETIAREVGARTLVLNPIEGLTPSEQAAGQGYADLMRQNLANLRQGLECPPA